MKKIINNAEHYTKQSSFPAFVMFSRVIRMISYKLPIPVN